MPIPFSSVLYYPTIDIQDQQWLRNALLFWDKLYTIVPESDNEPYKNSFSKEIFEMGILQPIHVSSNMSEINEFEDIVEDFITTPNMSDVFIPSEYERLNPNKVSQNNNEIMEELHYDKLPMILRRYLKNSGPWINFPRRFVAFYMTLLATKLAKERGLGVVTDSSIADKLVFAVENGMPYKPPYSRYSQTSLPTNIASGMLLELVVETITLPQNLSAIKIIDFKIMHSEELGIFRDEISRLTNDLSGCTSIDAMRQHVYDIYTAKIAPAMKSLNESIKLRSWDSAIKGFLQTACFSVPSSVAITSILGVPGSIALLAGTGVSLISSTLQIYRSRRETLNNNPYSYLLSLQRI